MLASLKMEKKNALDAAQHIPPPLIVNID